MSDEKLSPVEINQLGEQYLVDFLSNFKDRGSDLPRVVSEALKQRSQLGEAVAPPPNNLKNSEYAKYRAWEKSQRQTPQDVSLEDAYRRYVDGDPEGVWELIRGLKSNPTKLYEFLGLKPASPSVDSRLRQPSTTNQFQPDENQFSQSDLVEALTGGDYGFSPERYKKIIQNLRRGVSGAMPTVIMQHKDERHILGVQFLDLEDPDISIEDLVRHGVDIQRNQLIPMLFSNSPEERRAALTVLQHTETIGVNTAKVIDVAEALKQLGSVLDETEAPKGIADEWDKLRGQIDTITLDMILHTFKRGFLFKIDNEFIPQDVLVGNKDKISQLGMVLSVADIVRILRGHVGAEKTQGGEVLYRRVKGDTTQRYTRGQFSDQKWQTLIRKGMIMPAYDRPVGGLFNTPIDQEYFSMFVQQNRLDGFERFYDQIENNMGRELIEATNIVEDDGSPPWWIVESIYTSPSRLIPLDRKFIKKESRHIRLEVLEAVLLNGSEFFNDQTKEALGDKLIAAGFVDGSGNPDWGVVGRYLSSPRDYKNNILRNITNLSVNLKKIKNNPRSVSIEDTNKYLSRAEWLSNNLLATLNDQTKKVLEDKLIAAGFVDGSGNPDWEWGKLLEMIYSPQFQAQEDSQNIITQIIDSKVESLKNIIQHPEVKLVGLGEFADNDKAFQEFIRTFTNLDPVTEVKKVRSKQAKLLFKNYCYQELDNIVKVGLGTDIYLKGFEDLIVSSLFVDGYAEGWVRPSAAWNEMLKVVDPASANRLRLLFGSLATETRKKTNPLLIAAYGNHERITVPWLDTTSSGESGKDVIQTPLIEKGGQYQNLTVEEQKMFGDLCTIINFEPVFGDSDQKERDGLQILLHQAYEEAVLLGCQPGELGDHVIGGTNMTINQLADSILLFEHQRQKLAYTFIPRRSEQIALILERIQNADETSPLVEMKQFLQRIDLTRTMRSVSNKPLQDYVGLGIAGLMRWNLEYGGKEVYSAVKKPIKIAQYQKQANEIVNLTPKLVEHVRKLHRDMRLLRSKNFNFVPEDFFGSVTQKATESVLDSLPDTINQREDIIKNAQETAELIVKMLDLGSFLKENTERFVLELILQAKDEVEAITPAYLMETRGRDSTAAHLEIGLEGMMAYVESETNHIARVGYSFDSNNLVPDVDSSMGIVDAFFAAPPNLQEVVLGELLRVSELTTEYSVLLKSVGASTAFQYLNSPPQLYPYVGNMVGDVVESVDGFMEILQNPVAQSIVLRSLLDDYVQLPRRVEVVVAGKPVADVALQVKNTKNGILVKMVHMQGLVNEMFGDNIHSSPFWLEALFKSIQEKKPSLLSVGVIEDFKQRLALHEERRLVLPIQVK